MVEDILVAGRRVLVNDGYDAFSTNRIARAAGVSPGSLYQYFPDKLAILAVIRERFLDDISSRVAASLSDRVANVGPTMVRDTADALLAALEADGALLRVLTYDIPTLQVQAQRAALQQRVHELLTLYLRMHPSPCRRPDASLAAWVLVQAVENLTVRWVLDKPLVERGALLDEIDALVRSYVWGVASPKLDASDGATRARGRGRRRT